MGHAVGVPEKAGSGTWQLQVTFCDYDFTALYEEQTALFDAQRDGTFANYIAPEDMGTPVPNTSLPATIPAGAPRCCPAIPRHITCGRSTPPPMWKSQPGNGPAPFPAPSG